MRNTDVLRRALAANPVDLKIQQHAIIPMTYPKVIGLDLAGDVVEVGFDVTHLKKGDRVMA